jgi:hypothetical protein
VAEAARRKALLLADQLEAKTTELALALAEHADLEQELGRTTPDLQREVLLHQRSLDELSSPHSHAHMSGRTSPLEASLSFVMTCDVGSQAGVKVDCVEAGSQVQWATQSIACQAEPVRLDAGMQATNTTMTCGVQASNPTATCGVQASNAGVPCSVQTNDEASDEVAAVPSNQPLHVLLPTFSDVSFNPSPSGLRASMQRSLDSLPSTSTLQQALRQVPEALVQSLQYTCQPVSKQLQSRWLGLTKHATQLDTPVVKMAWLPLAGLCMLARPFAVSE